MELSDEQKQRILEEEQQRLAEEQYRAQIRSQLTAESLSSSQSTAASKPPSFRLSPLAAMVIAIGIIAVLSIGTLINRQGPRSGAEATDVAPVAASSIAGEKKPPPKQSPLKPVPEKLTTAQIAAKATPAVVVIQSFNEDGVKMGQGSGYLYSPDGVVVTNYHVVRGAKSAIANVPSKGSIQVEHLLGYSIEHDVAIVQLSQPVDLALQTTANEEAKVGDRVVAVGAPLGLESTVSEGIISAIRDGGTTHVLQTTASISPGSSGGPLMNEYGRVIGLTTAGMRDGQNLNFAVSTRHIADLIANRRPISFEEMLSETQVTEKIPANTISIAPRNFVTLNIVVAGRQGAVLEGSYNIRGGTGNDVRVSLSTEDNRVIVNSGLVKEFGELKQRLPMGRYVLLFDNRISTFSSKSVSPELKLTYYR